MSKFRVAVLATCLAAITNLSVQAQLPPHVAVPHQQKAHQKKPRMKKQKLGNVRPVHVLGDIYLAGQPTPEDLLLIKQAGVKTVITLRQTKELPWDEAAAVKDLGMKFVHAPFQSPQQLRPEVFDKVLKVLRDKKRGATFFHCGSANRVGAIWYAYRVLDGGLSPQEALEEAQIVGLRTPEYLERAQAYVETSQKAAAQKKP